MNQSLITRWYLTNVLNIHTTFYLRRGYSRDPELKRYGDHILRMWQMTKLIPYIVFLLAIWAVVVYCHGEDVFGKALCIIIATAFCSTYPLYLADIIRHEIMIDGT